MKIELSVSAFGPVMNDIEGAVAKAATGAMRETTPDTKQVLRDQTIGAGLGGRLANTWRGKVYPETGQSMNPTGFIHSSAPTIADAFIRGATIVPINGSKYLAIPTKNVPRALSQGRATSTKRMTPAQVEQSFGQKLFYRKGKQGHVLGFINGAGSRSARGFKRATGAQLASGRNIKPILMFTLVPNVRLPKLLDIDAPAAAWATSFESAFERAME
jgi:hypothetical protein